MAFVEGRGGAGGDWDEEEEGMDRENRQASCSYRFRKVLSQCCSDSMILEVVISIACAYV